MKTVIKQIINNGRILSIPKKQQHVDIDIGWGWVDGTVVQ